MSIKVNISRYFFGSWTNETVVTEVTGNTVQQCLNHLLKHFPNIKKEIFDEDGEFSAMARIFINGESAFPEELAKHVEYIHAERMVPM